MVAARGPFFGFFFSRWVTRDIASAFYCFTKEDKHRDSSYRSQDRLDQCMSSYPMIVSVYLFFSLLLFLINVINNSSRKSLSTWGIYKAYTIFCDRWTLIAKLVNYKVLNSLSDSYQRRCFDLNNETKSYYTISSYVNFVHLCKNFFLFLLFFKRDNYNYYFSFVYIIIITYFISVLFFLHI